MACSTSGVASSGSSGADQIIGQSAPQFLRRRSGILLVDEIRKPQQLGRRDRRARCRNSARTSTRRRCCAPPRKTAAGHERCCFFPRRGRAPNSAPPPACDRKCRGIRRRSRPSFRRAAKARRKRKHRAECRLFFGACVSSVMRSPRPSASVTHCDSARRSGGTTRASSDCPMTSAAGSRTCARMLRWPTAPGGSYRRCSTHPETPETSAPGTADGAARSRACWSRLSRAEEWGRNVPSRAMRGSRSVFGSDKRRRGPARQGLLQPASARQVRSS